MMELDSGRLLGFGLRRLVGICVRRASDTFLLSSYCHAIWIGSAVDHCLSLHYLRSLCFFRKELTEFRQDFTSSRHFTLMLQSFGLNYRPLFRSPFRDAQVMGVPVFTMMMLFFRQTSTLWELGQKLIIIILQVVMAVQELLNQQLVVRFQTVLDTLAQNLP